MSFHEYFFGEASSTFLYNINKHIFLKINLNSIISKIVNLRINNINHEQNIVRNAEKI
jgi:hypothetical protein